MTGTNERSIARRIRALGSDRIRAYDGGVGNNFTSLYDGALRLYLFDELTAGAERDDFLGNDSFADENLCDSVAGKFGNAVSFDAELEQQIYISPGSFFHPAARPLTVFATWVYVPPGTATDLMVLTMDGPNRVFYLVYSAGGGGFLLWRLWNDETSAFTGVGSAPAGAWYYVEIKLDSVAKTAAVRFNSGDWFTTSAATNAPVLNTEPLRIGGRGDGIYSTHLQDWLLVMDREITTEERDTITYNAGNGPASGNPLVP